MARPVDKQRVRDLLDKDLKVPEIARVVNVTPARIYQILEELRTEDAATAADEVTA